MSQPNLTKFAWLSIVAALSTIVLKVTAWRMTGSVGLLSDAAESLVNLAAAILALAMLTVAAKPPDENHQFGHTKAEYFSAAVEGIMIFIAAAIIIVTAVERLLHPAPLESLGIGIVISTGASVINGLIAMVLLRAGRKYRSPTLVADGKHLWTDVVTSIGVVVGILLVWLTNWGPLDPIVALLVGINIIITGAKLIGESTKALMDSTLSDEENAAIAAILADRTTNEVTFHGLRTRSAGRARFAIFDILVPGSWTVKRGHDLIEDVESEISAAFPEIQLTVHMEPREDPRAYNDFDIEIPIPAE